MKCGTTFSLCYRNLSISCRQQSKKILDQSKHENRIAKDSKLSKKWKPAPSNVVNESITKEYPDSVWTLARKYKNLYIGDKDIAREIADYVNEESKDVFIFEANPGPGFLTEALLKLKVPHLRVFEKNEAFISTLKVLFKRYPGRLRIVEKDMMLLPRMLAHDSYKGLNETSTLFHGIPKLSWTEDIPCKFVAIISSSTSINFMRFVFAKLTTMASFFSYGRFQFFLLLSDSEFGRMMAKSRENFSQYRGTTVFYNLFFEIKCLKKYPVSAFLPPQKTSSKKKVKHDAHLHLVRLTPKVDLLTSVADRDKLPHLYFFIRHHLTKRRRLVIPCLEQWIPFCGPKFIKKGMQVFTKFGDLSPTQILQLFHQFSSLPEYEDSPFHAAVDHFYDHKETFNPDDT